MQLTQIALKNFRVFEEAQLDIKPITIITGANSSGKSSVFKALMLLGENAKKNNLTKLSFESGGHILGSFESVRKRGCKVNDRIGFSLKGNFKDLTTILIYIFGQDENNGILSSSLVLANSNIPLIKLSKNTNYTLDFNAECITESNFDFKNLIQELFNKQLDNIVTVEKLYQEQEKILLEDIEKNAESNLVEEKETLEQTLKQKLIELENTYQQAKSQTNDEDELDRLDKEFNEKKEAEERQTWYVKFEGIKQKYISQAKEAESENLKETINEDYRQSVIFQIQKKIVIEQLNKSKIEELPIDLENWVQQFKDKFLSNESIAENPLNTYSAESGIEADDYIVDNLLRLDIRRAIYEYIIKEYIHLITNFIDFTHLPAVRGKQERIITFSNQNDVLENAVLNLLQKNYNPQNPNPDEKQQFIRKWLSNSIDKEKRKFEIGYDIEIETIDGNSVKLKILSDENNTEGRNLADFGLGISQLLPIILTCAIAEPHTLICIEEPETNLHPKFQSMLAEMFVDAHKTFKVQFALETHSEYLIRNLQYLIANQTITNDFVKIYYFNRPENITEGIDLVQDIPIGKDGEIEVDYEKFWKGFYDETTILQDKLEYANLKRNIADLEKITKKCLILTEDSLTDGIKILLEASGFDLNETEIQSYQNCDKIKVAFGMAEMAQKNPYIKKIIIHQDSDGEGSKRKDEADKHIQQHHLSKTYIFITEFNDIEGYFINPEHIKSLYPQIEIQELNKIIAEETEKIKNESIKNLTQKLGKNKEAAEIYFNHNPEKYRHSKEMKRKIHIRLKSLIKQSPNIIQKSEHIKIPELEAIAKEIWG